MIDLVYIYISNLSIHLSNLSRKKPNMNDEICQKDGCCQWFDKRMGGNTADFMNSCLDDHTAYLWGLIQVEKKRKTLQHLPSNIGSSCWTLLIYSWSIFQASWWHGQATWLSFPVLKWSPLRFRISSQQESLRLVVPPSWTCFTVLSTIKNVRHEALKFVGV